MPIVTTLHTVLGAPDPLQRRAMDEITRLSERLVVMSAHAAALLRNVHGVPEHKIDVIPHGIPSVSFAGRKNRLGVEGKSVILTFGLLSPDKGIEHVIDALPAILARYPDTVYIVLGATHPHIKEERYGEIYRESLERRAQTLRRKFQHDLSQPLCKPRRAHRVSLRRGHLRNALPQAGAEHIRDLGLCGGIRQGRDLHTVSVRAGATRRRARHTRALERSLGDRTRGSRSSQR